MVCFSHSFEAFLMNCCNLNLLEEVTQASAQTATQANTIPMKKVLEIGRTSEAFLYAFSLINKQFK